MEIQILNWLQSLHTPILDKIMQLITHLGDMGIIWIILTIVMLLIPKTRNSENQTPLDIGRVCVLLLLFLLAMIVNLSSSFVINRRFIEIN